LSTLGACVEVADGIQGLVHVSEISNKRVEKPSDVLKGGETVKVKVLNINTDEKRISLSIKQAQPAAEGEGNNDRRSASR
ncbi:S1 RNA-binding domain-containing protein, partial [Lactobacillus jensenii]|uniref:S1 RNA-binding domain-containing protein n=1 Tax=Lactobacillus jensenii TaxID=109790 RepID=UPI0028706EE4